MATDSWSCIVCDIETEWERNRLRRHVERLTAWGPLVDVLEENRVLRARLSAALGSGDTAERLLERERTK